MGDSGKVTRPAAGEPDGHATLTATLNGTAQMIDPPNVIATSETGVITGGTGRFAGATGTFHVDRIFNRATGETTGSFEGWISLAKG